jgi:hypothetical protein
VGNSKLAHIRIFANSFDQPIPVSPKMPVASPAKSENTDFTHRK